jgi:hypothetical protein
LHLLASPIDPEENRQALVGLTRAVHRRLATHRGSLLPWPAPRSTSWSPGAPRSWAPRETAAGDSTATQNMVAEHGHRLLMDCLV